MAIQNKTILFGTEAEFIAANPTLKVGEVVIITDKGASKMGDGVTTYPNLPYQQSVTVFQDIASLRENSSTVYDGRPVIITDTKNFYTYDVNDTTSADNGDGVIVDALNRRFIKNGGDSEWGNIAGSLSDQTDLITALNNKESLIIRSTTAPTDTTALWIDTSKRNTHILRRYDRVSSTWVKVGDFLEKRVTVGYTLDDVNNMVVIDAQGADLWYCSVYAKAEAGWNIKIINYPAHSFGQVDIAGVNESTSVAETGTLGLPVFQDSGNPVVFPIITAQAGELQFTSCYNPVAYDVNSPESGWSWTSYGKSGEIGGLGSSGALWGSITGTLSDQTDLVNVFNNYNTKAEVTTLFRQHGYDGVSAENTAGYHTLNLTNKLFTAQILTVNNNRLVIKTTDTLADYAHGFIELYNNDTVNHTINIAVDTDGGFSDTLEPIVVPASSSVFLEGIQYLTGTVHDVDEIIFTWQYIGDGNGIHKGGGEGSTSWGSITGTLSDQTDLNTKFGEFVPKTNTSSSTIISNQIGNNTSRLRLINSTSAYGSMEVDHENGSAIYNEYHGATASDHASTAGNAAKWLLTVFDALSGSDAYFVVESNHEGSVVAMKVASPDGSQQAVFRFRPDGKIYVNDVEYGGGSGSVSDASATTKGITKLSVAPAVAADPIALGANDDNVPKKNTANTFTQIQNYRDTNVFSSTSLDLRSFKFFFENELHPLYEILITGAQYWGAGGNSSVDTNFYRSAAGVLKTDGRIEAVDGFWKNGVEINTLLINAPITSYTLTITDTGKLITQNVATANTVTIPDNATVAFPIGTQIIVSQEGVGQITFTPATGVTMHSPDGANKTRVQYSTATLIKKAVDVWLLSGDIIV